MRIAHLSHLGANRFVHLPGPKSYCQISSPPAWGPSLLQCVLHCVCIKEPDLDAIATFAAKLNSSIL